MAADSARVSGAIKKRAGYKPFKELPRFRSIPLGEAVLTSAGRLPLKGIIHVAGNNALWRASTSSIQTSVRSAIDIGNDNRFESVAFPAIGAGSGGFNVDSSVEIMVETLERVGYPGHVLIIKYPDAKQVDRYRIIQEVLIYP